MERRAALDVRLVEFLDRAGKVGCVLFSASCVERGAAAFFMADAGDGRRSTDPAVFWRLLDDLWQPESADLLEFESNFPELQGDDEPAGLLAYAYDSVAAMFYALSYLASEDERNVVYCSNHMLNSAGLLDDAVGGGQVYFDEEVTSQLVAIEVLSGFEGRAPSSVEVLRDGARKVGRHRQEALGRMFPSQLG